MAYQLQIVFLPWNFVANAIIGVFIFNSKNGYTGIWYQPTQIGPRQVVDVYGDMLNAKNVSGEITDLVDLPGDFIISALYDNKGKNLKFEGIRKQMPGAKKFIFFIPEYNGYLSRNFENFH